MKVTFKGDPRELEGVQPQVGEKLPHFELKNLDNVVINNDTLKGSKAIISIFPDINTRVCDLQTRHFFQVAGQIPDVKILNISNNTQDQLRDWCATAGVDAEMLSDTGLSFAKAFGLYIPEMNILARSIFVVDEEGTIIHSEIVPEIAQEPDYEKALSVAK